MFAITRLQAVPPLEVLDDLAGGTGGDIEDYILDDVEPGAKPKRR
jgi:hypothetical protein